MLCMETFFCMEYILIAKMVKHVTLTYFSKARKAAGSTSGNSISVDVVAIPPLNIASKTALPTAKTNLQRPGKYSLSHIRIHLVYIHKVKAVNPVCSALLQKICFTLHNYFSKTKRLCRILQRRLPNVP